MMDGQTAGWMDRQTDGQKKSNREVVSQYHPAVKMTQHLGVTRVLDAPSTQTDRQPHE